MTTEINQEVIDHLRKLGNKEVMPINSRYGICFELLSKFDFDIMAEDFSGWHKFSGRFGYPIPHPEFDDPWEGCIRQHCKLGNLWTDDEYGNNRRELCLYLADLYEERLNKSYIYKIKTLLKTIFKKVF